MFLFRTDKELFQRLSGVERQRFFADFIQFPDESRSSPSSPTGSHRTSVSDSYRRQVS
jgi:hypothetical protein